MIGLSTFKQLYGRITSAEKPLALKEVVEKVESKETATGLETSVVKEEVSAPPPQPPKPSAPEKPPVAVRKFMADVAKLKELYAALEKERSPFTKTFIDLKMLSYSAKDTAKSAKFPLAEDFSRELNTYMATLKEVGDKELMVIKYHIDSMQAIITEKRRSVNDEATLEVMEKLKKIINAPN